MEFRRVLFRSPANRPVVAKPPREEDELSDIVTGGQDEEVKDIAISSEKKSKAKPKKKEVVLNL